MSPDILIGDVRERLAEIPAGHFHCCVTSPPYWGLRDYGTEGQIGLEPTPDGYVKCIVDVFRAVRRVLRDDGTCWVNLGDSYAAGKSKQYNSNGYDDPGWTNEQSRTPPPGLKPKDLIGIPWRVALALQADGWYLRSDIIWAKPNPMPESCTDRPTKSHEHIFLLTKKPRYYYDAEAVRETGSGTSGGACFGKQGQDANGTMAQQRTYDRPEYPTRNARDVWTITTQGYPDAHFATFPEELPARCIKAGTSERGCCPDCGAGWARVVEIPDNIHPGSSHTHANDSVQGNTQTRADGKPAGTVMRERNQAGRSATTTGWRPGCECDIGSQAVLAVPCRVLDPFLGSGTTLAVAAKLGRTGTGIELNPEYAKLAERRIGQAVQGDTYREPDKIEDAPLFVKA